MLQLGVLVNGRNKSSHCCVCINFRKFAQGNVHTYVILMYLLRKIYLSNITQLLICFVLRGVECTLAFINLQGREHLVGQAEEGEFGLPTLLAAGGARPRRGADTFCLCLAPSVTHPAWESPKYVTKYYILGQNSSTQTSPQLRPGLHMRGGARREAWDLSFLPTFSLPFLTLFVFLSLVHKCLLPFSASCSSSLPYSFNLPQKENHLKWGNAGRGKSP